MLCLQSKDFTLRAGQPVAVSVAAGEDSVVWTALQLFSRDCRSVLGAGVVQAKPSKAQIVVNTDKAIGNHPQMFRIEADKKGRLLVTGTDKRGTAYGIMELSRMMGVSPWEWWADVTPGKLEQFTLPEGYKDEQWPSVEYRGIFINDEDVGFTPWATKTYDQPKVDSAAGRNLAKSNDRFRL